MPVERQEPPENVACQRAEQADVALFHCSITPRSDYSNTEERIRKRFWANLQFTFSQSIVFCRSSRLIRTFPEPKKEKFPRVASGEREITCLRAGNASGGRQGWYLGLAVLSS